MAHPRGLRIREYMEASLCLLSLFFILTSNQHLFPLLHMSCRLTRADYNNACAASDPLVRNMIHKLLPLLSSLRWILVFGKPAFDNVVVGDPWNLSQYFIQTPDERLPHMTLIVMGWLVPRLRTNLLNVLNRMVAELLGVTEVPIPEDQHDSYAKCKKTGVRANGAPAKKGDVVWNVLGEMVMLQGDLFSYFEGRDEFQLYCQTASQQRRISTTRSLDVAERHGQTTAGMYWCSGCRKSFVGRYNAHHVGCGSYSLLKLFVNGQVEFCDPQHRGYCRCGRTGPLNQWHHSCAGGGGADFVLESRPGGVVPVPPGNTGWTPVRVLDLQGSIINSFDSVGKALPIFHAACIAALDTDPSSVPEWAKKTRGSGGILGSGTLRAKFSRAINAGEILKVGGKIYIGVPIEDAPTS